MDFKELKELLDIKYEQYNKPVFITTDPLSIPHMFTKKEDIEIAAFFASTIAWGQRTTIIKNALTLMTLMDMSPHDFILNSNKYDFRNFKKFAHRTFNSNDCIYFIRALKYIYNKYDSLENAFLIGYSKDNTIRSSIIEFRKDFFKNMHETRVEKHVSNPEKNSACKRLNLFLRWMVRDNNTGVDLGIWKSIPSSALLCPLDVHSARVSRKLGLLTSEKNNWDAVQELTDNLKKFDADDPAKYDFALFGLGIFENF